MMRQSEQSYWAHNNKIISVYFAIAREIAILQLRLTFQCVSDVLIRNILT